jgi:hypothetical protein
VEEFNAVRKPKAQAADGKRAQLSPLLCPAHRNLA